MSNMSYCRFENTAADLQDCVDAIQRGDARDLDGYERSGLKKIMQLCKDLVDEQAYIQTLVEDEIL